MYGWMCELQFISSILISSGVVRGPSGPSRIMGFLGSAGFRLLINFASGGGSNTLTRPDLECCSIISSTCLASDVVVGPSPSQNSDEHIQILYPLPNTSSGWNSTPLSMEANIS